MTARSTGVFRRGGGALAVLVAAVLIAVGLAGFRWLRPDQVSAAERVDRAGPGEGWTCFGGSGLPGDFGRLDDASWLGA